MGLLMILMVAEKSYGQFLIDNQYVYGGNTSLDVPVDPHSIAMGESFVALRGNTSAMMYNPASLAAITGAIFSYAQRRLNYSDWLNDFKYQSLAGVLHTPYGVAGISYDRFSEGDIAVATGQFPEGTGDIFGFYNYVLGLSAARSVAEKLDIGLTFKTADVVEEFIKKDSATVPIYESTRPVLFDVGAIYHLPGPFHRQDVADDEITVGTSLQNFGTDFRMKLVNSFSTGSPVLGPQVDQLIKLPRYLRIVFSYSLELLPEHSNDFIPFKFVGTGEYCNLLNVVDIQSADHDFWGFGGEASFYEIVSLRLGGFISPYYNRYGNRGVPSLRYGGAVSIPLKKMIEFPDRTIRRICRNPSRWHPGLLLGSTIQYDIADVLAKRAL